jgi:hypothetical protein
MTNTQAQAYAIIALKSLIEDGIVKADATKVYHALDHEMHSQFDNWDEETAEKRAIRILMGN